MENKIKTIRSERKRHTTDHSINILEERQQNVMTGRRNTKEHPTLLRISDLEAQAITSCFRLYDFQSKGIIARSSAEKLVKSLGICIPESKLSEEMTLNEFLLLCDQWSPNPDPPLECSLVTWAQLNGHHHYPSHHPNQSHNSNHHPNHHQAMPTTEKEEESNDSIVYISAENISEFMESIGKPPISMSEANCLLTSMLEYDDCSIDPKIPIEIFMKQISIFARKSNLIKDLSKI